MASDFATRSWFRRETGDPAMVTDGGYRPDLDGLRAVAVGLVMLAHARLPWVNDGGDVGVTAFFVLSGYVITVLLCRNQATAGRAGLLAFYRRRVTRLGPALLGLLAFVIVVGLLAGWPTEWRLGILACLGYVSNWVQAAGINIDPLGHTWSLAIEEQFYLLWPALLLVVFRKRRSWLIAITLGAIVAMSLARLVATGTTEYFSTFTRADAILLAACWRSPACGGRLSSRLAGWSRSWRSPWSCLWPTTTRPSCCRCWPRPPSSGASGDRWAASPRRDSAPTACTCGTGR